MQLFLVRHGDYVPESVNPEKPLSDKGRKDVANLANALKDQGFTVEAFIHSTKKRAKETAEILKSVLNPEATISARQKLSPNDLTDDIVQEISTWDKNTMVVGHAPFMPKLASILLELESESQIKMPTSSVVILEKEEQQWEMVTVITLENIKT